MRTIFVEDIKNRSKSTECLKTKALLYKNVYSQNHINNFGNHKRKEGAFDYQDVVKYFSLEEVAGKNKEYFDKVLREKRTLQILHFTHNEVEAVLGIKPSYDFYGYSLKARNNVARCGNVNVVLVTYEY
ncbi:MAG: hypothetical protein P8P83_03045 [Rickettsiaceae bacterium]|nr:hypothetical protein [Rickettsiaceae bacterium]